MRDFFIRGLEMVINIIMVLLIIGLMAFAAALTLGAVPVDNAAMANTPLATTRGPIAGLAVLIGGGLYLIVMGGFAYLGLGIYQNTRRTAEALERMVLE